MKDSKTFEIFGHQSLSDGLEFIVLLVEKTNIGKISFKETFYHLPLSKRKKKDINVAKSYYGGAYAPSVLPLCRPWMVATNGDEVSYLIELMNNSVKVIAKKPSPFVLTKIWNALKLVHDILYEILF